jgi:hypothetical protein
MTSWRPGSVLLARLGPGDVTAVVALVGGMVIDLVALWVIGIFASRSTATTA